jgi:hypothetical protein
VRPVSSVAAFIAEHAVGDPTAASIVDSLDEDARLAVAAQRQPLAERRAWLRERTSKDWSAAWLAHVEQGAFVRIRRELQRRGMWRA